jgi:hypothetical protein
LWWDRRRSQHESREFPSSFSYPQVADRKHFEEIH